MHQIYDLSLHTGSVLAVAILQKNLFPLSLRIDTEGVMLAKKLLRVCFVSLLIVLSSARSIYDFTVNTLAGKPLPLTSFQSSPVSFFLVY
jgi:hypothetical protein